MFNFCELPFCTSYLLTFNGELLNIDLNIYQYAENTLAINKSLEITLNIEQNNTIIL